MYLVTIFFQGLEFGYCVFLLSRQCDKSKHFKTLKLSKKVCLKFKSTIWGSWTPVSNLRLCLMQSSVPTDSPTQPTRTKFQPWMIQAANKIQELRKSRKNPKVQTLLWIHTTLFVNHQTYKQLIKIQWSSK
jgi:hypothetical protein